MFSDNDRRVISSHKLTVNHNVKSEQLIFWLFVQDPLIILK